MLPTFPEYMAVSWIPVDVAADGVVDVIFYPSDSSYLYLNLVHVNPVSWHSIFVSIAETLGGLPLVPYEKWYTTLKEISAKPGTAEKITAVNLVDFFAPTLTENDNREAMGMKMMAIDRIKISHSVAMAGLWVWRIQKVDYVLEGARCVYSETFGF
ncbi:hypothetical protein K435DRAFT_857895 [Dendrothele bispora CBS 962.96]|uniref:Uncharacterized protein n=1 Tax=Dendrothele bispora (strain CBS 962.96) TaxID=1314807 RepID=A0A4S8M4H2_DENBC|nr:hypothetical protein K435DRAFT_857895 [Dendrothele bispora CBS 962.96]